MYILHNMTFQLFMIQVNGNEQKCLLPKDSIDVDVITPQIQKLKKRGFVRVTKK